MVEEGSLSKMGIEKNTVVVAGKRLRQGQIAVFFQVGLAQSSLRLPVGLLTALLLVACTICPAWAAPVDSTNNTATGSKQDTEVLSASIVKVLSVKNSGYKRLTRLLLASADGRNMIWEDRVPVRAVEEENEILFDDFVGKDMADRHIQVELKGFDRLPPGTDGLELPLVQQVKFVRSGKQTEFVKVEELAPAPPAADQHHRYISVPVSYKKPELGEFRLYYETNSDFDPSRPTLIIPSDAQGQRVCPGSADKFKKSYGLSCNLLTYQYRGTGCSDIPQLSQKDRVDWQLAWDALNISNAIEDIDRIRADLLGPSGKLNIYGGSGIAVLGLAYLSKHSEHVDRAFLMSFFKDAKGSCDATIDFFNSFLRANSLESDFEKALKYPGMDQRQLFFVLQRLLYSDQKKCTELITKLGRGDRSCFDQQASGKSGILSWGSVDYYVHSSQLNCPQEVVFFYETNVPTAPPGGHDINEASLEVGTPVEKLINAGIIKGERLDIGGLDKIKSEVLVVSGSLDQVCPVGEQTKVFRQLANARQAVFKGYHCLEDQREFRKLLLETFLKHGCRSNEFEALLHSPRWKDLLVELH
jgi:pimeloyl-ACP methyl ester carboxylesterase